MRPLDRNLRRRHMAWSSKTQPSTWLLAGAVMGIAAIVVFAPFPDDTPLWKEIENAGHAPIFGIVALLLVALSRNLSHRAGIHPYWSALVGTVVLGAATELLQIPIHRDAEVGDFLRDVVGGIAFLGFYRTFDRSAARLKHEACVRIGTVLMIIAVFVPAILWALTLAHRDVAFPRIVGFDSIWDSRLCSTINARIERVRGGARITYQPAEYSTFSIDEPYPDWTGYQFFSFVVYSDLPDTVHLVLRIHDRHHDNGYDDRMNMGLAIHAGRNEIRLPVEMIRRAPKSRTMDVSAIRGICLFAMRPTKSFSINVSEFRCSNY